VSFEEDTMAMTGVMMAADEAPIRPSVIQAERSPFDFGVREVWNYRELLFYLSWRDVTVRYKQTVIGIGWAIIQPFLTMIVFSLVFGRLAKIPSDGIPYPIFSYTALVPWTYFSSSVTRAVASLVSSASIVKKVYFPRLILPTSSVLSPLVDLAVSFIMLVGLMYYYHFIPTWRVIFLPLFVILAVMTALAVGLWASSLHARYRDVGYAIPFILQLWMFASPVIYPVSSVPAQLQLVYSLNPMTSVIEGFRWALLDSVPPDPQLMAVSTLMVFVVLIGGIMFFRRMEIVFEDVI
jgi:lipopolysaccharide transport system permease protein